MTPFFRPEPIQHPHIPVYISAVGPVMCRVAGETCDGLRIHPLCSTKYLNDVILPNVELGAKAAGRTLAEIDLIAGGFIVPGDTDEEIRHGKRLVANRIGFYGSTRTYQRVLDVHGWGGLTKDLHEFSVQDRWDDMPDLITDEMLEAFAVIGSTEDCARGVLQRFGSACSTVSLDPSDPWADDAPRPPHDRSPPRGRLSDASPCASRPQAPTRRSRRYSDGRRRRGCGASIFNPPGLRLMIAAAPALPEAGAGRVLSRRFRPAAPALRPVARPYRTVSAETPSRCST